MLLFSFAPELASLTTEQLPGAMALIAKTNPARAQQIEAQFQRTKALWAASQQAEQQRAAVEEQRVQQWVAAEEQKFDREVLARENPETVRKIKEALPEILTQDYGISREDLAHAVQTNPILRSAAFSSVLLDAAKYRMAQKEVVTKLDRSAPPVQRPGVAAPHRNNDHIDAALKQFRSEPSIANAAKLLQARRSSR